MTLAYIGLGSNLDNPASQIERAIQAISQLPESRLLQLSDFYQSRAIGPGSQPDYLNAAIALETTLPPDELLLGLQAIENAQGRVRTDVRWTARTLDLDILLYGDETLHTDTLTVPHPYATQRNFVLLPLYDLDPELVFPDGTALRSLMVNLSLDGICRL